MKINELKGLLAPALFCVKASGNEIKPCVVCNERVHKDEKVVEIFTSHFKNNANYTKRFHRKCFLKVLAVNFPELIVSEIFDKEFLDNIKAELLLSKVEGEENK